VMAMLKTEDGRFWVTVKEAAARLGVSPFAFSESGQRGKD